MSLFKVPGKGEIEPYAEFGNAWHGAMQIWSQVCKRYLGRDFSMASATDGGDKECWNLTGEDRVPFDHRIVLASTFDTVMVKRENIPRLIQAMEQYIKDFDEPGHLPAQIEKLTELVDDESCFAVCWQQTSCADTWFGYDECPTCGHEKSRPYDVSKDEDHWFLFDDVVNGVD